MTSQDIVSSKQVLERNRMTLNNRDMDAYLNNQVLDVEITSSNGTLHGREQLRQLTEAMWKTFPDGVITFGRQVFGGDLAVTEVIITGTQTGPMITPTGTIPPTGKPIKLHSMSILKIKDGQIVSERNYSDSLELMMQLGLASTTPINNS